MSALDWSQCPAVESMPGRLSGAWVFRDTRMPISAVFENLEAGATIDEIEEWFDISKEQIIEVLRFAALSVAAPVPEMVRELDAHPVRPPHSGVNACQNTPRTAAVRVCVKGRNLTRALTHAAGQSLWLNGGSHQPRP
jgi:uncharacterized protein (DUF433 family)